MSFLMESCYYIQLTMQILPILIVHFWEHIATFMCQTVYRFQYNPILPPLNVHIFKKKLSTFLYHTICEFLLTPFKRPLQGTISNFFVPYCLCTIYPLQIHSFLGTFLYRSVLQIYDLLYTPMNWNCTNLQLFCKYHTYFFTPKKCRHFCNILYTVCTTYYVPPRNVSIFGVEKLIFCDI